MRDEKLVEDGSVCEGDFMDGVDTVDEWQARADERERCRFFPRECPALRSEGPDCIFKAGQDVARFTNRLGTSVDDEMKDFSAQAPMRGEGWFDPRIEEPEDATMDREEVVERVGTAAGEVLGIQSVDSASVNKEFKEPPDAVSPEEYPVLGQSVFDSESSIWVHSCGATLATTEVRHPVRLKTMPLAGPGRVVTKRVPHCPSCEDEPDPNGAPVYAEDEATEEEAELEKIRRVGERLSGGFSGPY